MKPHIGIACAAILSYLCAAASGAAPGQAGAVLGSDGRMVSQVIHGAQVQLAPAPNGARAVAFEAPTVTLERFHVHVTRLDPGKNTGAPHRHPQEELVLLRSGTLEVSINGKVETAEAGSMIFYAANELENMRNPGTEPAVYWVIQFWTDATPRG